MQTRELAAANAGPQSGSTAGLHPPSGVLLAPATLDEVGSGLGMVSAPNLAEYDLTIVGAGPPVWRQPCMRPLRVFTPSPSSRSHREVRRGQRQ